MPLPQKVIIADGTKSNNTSKDMEDVAFHTSHQRPNTHR
jgi:hypothetical protein